MVGLNVTLNSAGIREILLSAGVRSVVLAEAESTAATARATAPVRTGAYRDSISATTDTTDRVVGRVVATAPHAAVVESRTGNLARALG